MDEMSALEQQIARVARQSVGPLSSADIGVVTRAAMSPRSRWDLESVFSTARFVVAGVVVALLGGLLLAGVLTQQTDEPRPGVEASASPSPEAAYVVTRVATAGLWGRSLRSLATDEALWVPNDEGVARLDSVTNELTRIPLSTETQWLVPTDDAVWAVGPVVVHRIDRANRTVTDSIDIGGRIDADLGQPLIADGSLWLATTRNGSSSLVEIDLATRTVASEHPAPADWSQVAYNPWGAVIGDSIWVHSDNRGHRLTRFDLITRDFTEPIDVAGSASPQCCIALDDAIWLVEETGTLKRFDLATLEVTDTLDLASEPIDGNWLGGGIAAAGSIWVSDLDDSGGKVHRVDPTTRQSTDVIAVGSNPEPPAFIDGAIWVSDHSDKTVSRIDVESRRVTDTLVLPLTHLHTPLASEDVIWVYTQEGFFQRIDANASAE